MGDILKKETLPKQIYQILRADILSQEIPCGTKLTLQSLKERFGVSHTPIREALTHLVDDGLVVGLSNVGISVITLNDQDIREIFRLDYELERIATEMILEQNRMEAFARVLQANAEECEEVLKQGDIRRWGELSDQFHLAFYEHAGNSRLNLAASKLRAQTTLLYNLYRIEEGEHRRIQDHHNAICRAFQKGEIPEGIEELRRHLREDRDQILCLYQKVNS